MIEFGDDPQAWLADVPARMPEQPAQDMEDLLPWNWKKTATDILAARVEHTLGDYQLRASKQSERACGPHRTGTSEALALVCELQDFRASLTAAGNVNFSAW